MTEILIVENLTKHFRSHWTFKKKRGIHEVCFSINEGELFGFLGHNGAGKTTTMKCVLNLVRMDFGKVIFNNEELKTASQRANIGYLPELPYFYDHLNVEETLSFFAALYGLSSLDLKNRVKQVLEKVGLADRKKDKIRSLSKGLQQRIAFAQAILNKPKLLFLDEPFSGLDPNGRAEFRKLILEINEQGTTILISSHILPDIQDICDKVVIMVHGKICKEIKLEELSNPEDKTFTLILRNCEKLQDLASIMQDKILHYQIENKKSSIVRLEFGTYQYLCEAINFSLCNNIEMLNFGHKEKQLEDIFLEVMNTQNPINQSYLR